ncbi:MetQ/NlpA family ABC transporter substrate-binding protein [Acidaminococcus timonensis]|jgi:D-methionine transport system substrate-binding protein|uniref:MetQ/NlpA family ABC transporter substrate-binding protein n=1 Tax=Acidaminococcus timonensis TaxID=1871002 RepID=UPI0025D42CCF|nr:MetQ/NlpA family ABC transporter substrate-binding protein [Acidaminococcus timonensis]MDD6569510.1 MetQ/NlpA family ABC transporter substrate-binding protein [Acidaminococcus sp.]
MKLKKLIIGAVAVLALASLTAGCGSSDKKAAAPAEKKTITVGITPGYSEQVMEVVKQEAAKQGLTVEIKTFSDYVTPDQALAQKDIDLNSFQHEPFLQAFNKKNGTKLVSIGKTYLAPLKLYSTKIKDIKDIPDGAKIAIPNDPSNGGRAILMLSKLGLLKVNPDVKATDLTVNDITDNPKHLQILELEAAQLPRSLDDTTASVINAGYANSAKLAPELAIAKEDNTSPYVNIIAAREEDKDNPTYKKFVQIFQSQPVKEWIEKNAKGSLEPAW